MSDCLLCPMPMNYEMMAYDTFTETVVLTESKSWVQCISNFSKYSFMACFASAIAFARPRLKLHANILSCWILLPLTVPVVCTNLRVTDSARWFIEIQHDESIELSDRWSIAIGASHYVGETHIFSCEEYNYAGSVSAGFSIYIGLSGLGKTAANTCAVQGSVSIPIQFQCRV